MDWMNDLAPQWFWFALGLFLCAAEIIAPGVFLIWLGTAALVTGVLVWVLPIGVPLQVVIFAVLALIFGVDAAATPLSEMSLATLPSQIAVLNLVLAVFNLLPAFPMDGGRVLRALLALTTDRVRATRIAAIAGQVLAFGMGLFGLVAGNPMLLLIAFFIFVAAGAESGDCGPQHVHPGITLGHHRQ